MTDAGFRAMKGVSDLNGGLQVLAAMKEAGAVTYLTKDAAPEQLRQAILTAHGHPFLCCSWPTLREGSNT